MLTILGLVTLFVLWPLSARSADSAVRQYAHRLVVKRWHSEAQWEAFKRVIQRESGWNPCAVFPGRVDCSYAGANSCGLAQRNPCPGWMRGRLWKTRYAQVRNAVEYMAARYGSPVATLAHWDAHGSY